MSMAVDHLCNGDLCPMAGQQPRPGEPEQTRLRIRSTMRWSVAAAPP